MTVVLSPRIAEQEIERVVAKARAHPDQLEHWFRMLPAGSVDLLAFSLFVTLVGAEEA